MRKLINIKENANGNIMTQDTKLKLEIMNLEHQLLYSVKNSDIWTQLEIKKELEIKKSILINIQN